MFSSFEARPTQGLGLRPRLSHWGSRVFSSFEARPTLGPGLRPSLSHYTQYWHYWAHPPQWWLFSPGWCKANHAFLPTILHGVQTLLAPHYEGLLGDWWLPDHAVVTELQINSSNSSLKSHLSPSCVISLLHGKNLHLQTTPDKKETINLLI